MNPYVQLGLYQEITSNQQPSYGLDGFPNGVRCPVAEGVFVIYYEV